MPRDFVFTKEFPADGTFGAFNAAESWLTSIGCSYGSMQMDAPIAVVRGEWPLPYSKWRHFSAKEKASFDGQIEPMNGRFREGGAVVRLRFNPEEVTRAA